jgi:uncharacterized protein YfbU (UPF0304 family)
MAPKTLTPVERLELINQFRILGKLYPEHGEDYAESREIIAHGYTIQYEEVFKQVFEEMDIEQCKYVFDVLDMYRMLIQSYDALTDKKGLKPGDVRFRGFDGNNESDRYAFAGHLQEQGKWPETLTGDLNSHSMTTMTLYPLMFGEIRTDPQADNGVPRGGLATDGRADQRSHLVGGHSHSSAAVLVSQLQ